MNVDQFMRYFLNYKIQCQHLRLASFSCNLQEIEFTLEKILLVPHGGSHNDTIVIVERKIERIPIKTRVKS